MELLVILLGEFIFFPMITAFVATMNLAFTLLLSLVEFFISVVIPNPKIVEKEKSSLGTKLSLKNFAKITGSFFLVIILVLFTVNIFFFTPTMKWIVGQISQSTNIKIVFDSVNGNFLTGLIRFNGLHVTRNNSDKSDFNIKVDNIVVDVDVYSLILKPIIIEKLIVSGVKGMAQSTAPIDKDKRVSLPDEGKVIKAKTEFIVQNLSIKNVDVRVSKLGNKPLNLVLDSIEAKPFRSRYAIFDIFFRSNIDGSLDGHKIIIKSREEGNGRVTKWHLDHFPVDIVNQYIQKAPINWFSRGVIDIQVEDKWEYGENAQINMDWNLKLLDVFIEAPEGASIMSKTLSLPIIKYINNKNGDIDVNFGLKMNESQFESTSSLDAAGLWHSVVSSFSKKLAFITGRKADDTKKGIKSKVDSFKSFLNEKRK